MPHAGGLLGGYLGDKAAVRYPNHGRIFVVQISVITGPIFSLWLFKVWSGIPPLCVLYPYPDFWHWCALQTTCMLHPHLASWHPRAQAMPLNGEPATVVAYAMLLLAFGLMKSWSAPACNNPIFSMLVPPHCRNLVYAFDRWVLSKQRGLNLPACNHRESSDASRKYLYDDAARLCVWNGCAGALKVSWQ